MSLFSFGSSKHSTFHARITVHELDNVPLLQGAFQVKWKVGNAHSLPPGVQLTSQKESGAKEAGGDKGKGKGKEGEQHAHHHHHHHQHNAQSAAGHKHQRASPTHQSQQISAKDLSSDLLSGAEKRKSRKERQFASDPGGGPSASSVNIDAEEAAADVKDAEPAASGVAMSKSSSQVGSFLSIEGSVSEVESRPEDAMKLFEPGGANKHPHIAPPRRDEELEEERRSMGGSSIGRASVESLPVVEPSPPTPASGSSKQSGRFSRLFHGLNTGSPGSSSPVPSRQNSSSGTPNLGSTDNILHGSQAASGPSSPVHGRDYAHPPSHPSHHHHLLRPHRKASGTTSTHTGKKLSILTHNGRSQLKRVASPPISETISLAIASPSPSPSHSSTFPLKHAPSQDFDENEKGKEEQEGEQAEKNISVTAPDTPGLDLTRPRGLSISSKESSSQLSVATSDSKPAGGAAKKSGEGQADTASLASKSSSIEKAKESKGKEKAKESSSTRAAGSVTNGAAQASSHVASALSLDLEPKGDTEEVNVKDHCVKWERTFEVGIKVPIEKYKPPKDLSGSSSSLSLNGLGQEHGLSGTLEKGSQGGGGSNGASGHSTPGGGSGGPGLRHKRSRGALRKDSEEEWIREKERRRELAEAWGILGKATLHLNVKQRIETDGSHTASSTAGSLGFVELNLAEYAPWPPSSVQAQVLAPHRAHGNSTSTPRSRNRPMRRHETRRYLLRDSKTNARLKLTIALTHVSGIREYAVPSIKRGLPVNSLPGYVSASTLGKNGASMRHASGEQYSDDEMSHGIDQGEGDRASCCSGSSKQSGPRKSEASSRNGSNAWAGGNTSQCSPYGHLLLKAPDTMLRSSIPAKNLRSTAGTNDKSSRSRNFAGGSFVERDPASVIDMIFDQAKFQASMAVGSRTSFSGSGSSLQLPDASLERSKSGSRDEGNRPSSSPSSNPASRQSSWRNFSFRSRKISGSGKGSKDSDASLLALQPPSNMQHQLSRRRSSSSVSALANSSISAAVGVRSDRSLSPGRDSLAPILTSSPDNLSRATSRDSNATETHSSLSPAVVAPPSSTNSGAASSAALSVPNIDISSPGGRTYSSFQTMPFGTQPDDSGDRSDLSFESDASMSSIVEHRLPLRRLQSDPAIVSKGREIPSLAVTPVSPVTSQQGQVTHKADPVKKKSQLRGSKGIPPEQAHQRGYKGIGWQTSLPSTRSSRAVSPSASIGRENPDSRRQSIDRLDLLKGPSHGLSRQSSSSAESCGSLQAVGCALISDPPLAGMSQPAAA